MQNYINGGTVQLIEDLSVAKRVNVNYTVLLVIRKNIQSFMLVVRPLAVKRKSFI